jgi:glyoxylase-like metal-dependent hydrolase (beta-lactamase superfamily II)/rhodanese-related sulfurtransferase
VVDDGLGNSAYLLDLGDGQALAVDATRDLRALRRAADRRGLRIAYAADTHLHADFLSGAVQLAADDGATVLASATGMRAFDHRGLHDGDEVDLGGLTLRAMTTPGHTDEHLSFLLLDGAATIGVFTGGSLIVGGAARTDLLGAQRMLELAHAQYASLRRLATLPPETAVWPTHGAGSFCSAPASADRTSTIGAEVLTNPLLAAPDADTFARLLTAGLGSYPAYFAWLSEANRLGPPVISSEPVLAGLTADQVAARIRAGAVVVDVRPVAEMAAGHIPGAISIALRPAFATWLGWLVDPARQIVIVRDIDQPPGDIMWPALAIGYTGIIGELAGGMAAWRVRGRPTATIDQVGPGRVHGHVLDVRQDNEFAAGHLPHARHIELGALPGRAKDVEDGPVTVMCEHGERAMTAASLLRREGHRAVSVLAAGAGDWARATGRRLEPAS